MGIPSLIRFLKHIQESPMMAGSSTPGTQIVVPPPAPPPPPPAPLPHHVVSGTVPTADNIVGLASGGATQPFNIDPSGGCVTQQAQPRDPQQLAANSSHILGASRLHPRPPHGQNPVKSDPSATSFVYLLPPPETTNPPFGPSVILFSFGVINCIFS